MRRREVGAGATQGGGHAETRANGRVCLWGRMAGWNEVVTQLSVGEKARCTIPADLAYGAKGFPGLIPVNTSLYVELELLSVTTPEME